MMKSYNKFPNLIFIIYSDLFFHAKHTLLLLFFVVVSGISIVMITYQTRELIVLHENILLEKDALEIENRHLLLEEKVLSNIRDIERFAIKYFSMRYVDSNEENVIYFYN